MWELVFMLLILKLPIVYLFAVVYYAIRSEPRPEEGAAVTARIGPDAPGPGWHRLHPRNLRPRPHGGPARRAPRTPRTALARAEADRR